MSSRTYRFKLNTRVLCRTGDDTWSAGTIVALDYTEERFRGRIMPYQVQLDNGSLIFVPFDSVEVCKLLVPTWWEHKVFKGKPESWFSQNPPADMVRKAYESLHQEVKDVNATDHLGETALMRAAYYNWESGVEELLKLGADVNKVTAQNKHALHYAVTHGEAITKRLIDAKASLDCQEDDPDFDPDFTSKTFGDRKSHRTPLQIATLLGDTSTAKLLLSAGADINVRDAKLKTSLHLAIEEKDENMIELLLSHKADVNLGNVESGMNNTPLMDAAHTKNLSLVKMLLSARAAINQQGKQGMSAIHLAARKGEAGIVQALLEAKADVSQESQCGTVDQLARKNGSSELLKVLGLVKDNGDSVIAGSMTAAQRAELYLD